ncbi:MAG TPA: MopE-related protein [Polyangia bacterium]|nr:MopE-related protein [Polyangia bacterium]
MNCGNNADLSVPVDLAAAPNDLASGDLVTPVDLAKPVGEGGPCAPTNGGVEICDKLDNDCNGITDDVNPEKTVGDPNNCGMCGNVCDFTAMHQFGACVGGFDGGMPTCVPTTCLPGYVDLHDPLNPGCQYKCNITNGGVEACDGLDNDCNGVTDDGFGFPNYATDKNNCGACGNVCNLQGAVSVCKAGAGGKGVCGVDHCINNGTDTYKFNAATAGGKTEDQIGCNYHCPVASTTVTAGSNDCMNTACSFPPEVCDGIDNNCNFLIDDSPTDVGGQCASLCPGGLLANCVGECKPGTIVCSSGVKICQNLPGAKGPMPEVCDTLDNDCNGITDDGFGFPNYNVDAKNCGVCNHVCNLAHATNKCVTDNAIDPTGKGVCEVLQCNAGFNYAPLSPKAGDPAGTCTGGPPGPENGPSGVGCYYTCPVNPQAPESCDGKDNNCDGCVDNGLTVPANFCNNTTGVCSGVPVQATCAAAPCIALSCTGASGWKCDYTKVPNVNLDANGNLSPVETFCDKLDNNCNGVTDTDGFPGVFSPPTTVCSAGVGACRNSGFTQCNPMNKLQSGCFDQQATPQPVTASPANARDESCNGKDDNCDGQIDERTPMGAITCYTGPGMAGPHACLGWKDPMVKVTSVVPNVYVYEYEATRPDATAASQGGNSTRACSNAGVIPWSNITEAQAAAACAAVKDSTGASMRLCTAPEWQAACEGPTPVPAPPDYSLSQSRNAYVVNICNNADHPGGAVWATGTNSGASATNFCYTDWSSVDPGPAVNRLYDMSGNLNEWTSTTVTSGGNTYFKVRGGNFLSPQGGSTCEFDFDIFPASFANNDVGFRCCSANAP